MVYWVESLIFININGYYCNSVTEKCIFIHCLIYTCLWYGMENIYLFIPTPKDLNFIGNVWSLLLETMEVLFNYSLVSFYIAKMFMNVFCDVGSPQDSSVGLIE